MSDEWGPWIEHDGKGCPCKGMVVRIVTRSGVESVVVATGAYSRGGSAWDWGSITFWTSFAITRYQIRRPRALLQLIEMVENLPAPAQPRADA